MLGNAQRFRPSGRLPAFAAFLVLASTVAVSSRGEEPPRTVIVALDAVPYSVVAEMTRSDTGEAPLFEGFRGPVPLISTFPSTTSLALAAILEPFGLELSPGYEAKHFDLDLNEIRGGGPVSYRRLKFPWREFFDWKLEGLWKKMTSALRPVKISLRAVERSLDAFMTSDEEVYFIYYDTTDLVGHLRSPDSLRPVLHALDAKLRALRAEHPERPFHTVLFSDHGMAGGEPMRSVRRDVARALEAAGFERRQHLDDEGDVVLVPFGLVSSFIAFTLPGRGAELAEALATVEGVEICAAPENGGYRVAGARGSAAIRRRGSGEATGWAYELIDGDPLGYAPVARRLGDRHPGAGSYFPDREWLHATRGSNYPDALYRIAGGFELVEHPASVICSTAPGYLFGAALTTFSSRVSVGRLEWTHGALRREDSYGFLMSDAPGWHPDGPVRFSEALEPFAD